MKKIAQVMVAALVLTAFFAASALAGDKKDEARALVKKAVALIKQNGPEQAFAEINAGKLTKGELYVFILDSKGSMVAHGGNPKLVGKSLYDVKDAEGNYITRDHLGVAKKGGGWSKEYKWTNPTSKKIEQKVAYIEPAGDLAVGCGIYK